MGRGKRRASQEIRIRGAGQYWVECHVVDPRVRNKCSKCCAQPGGPGCSATLKFAKLFAKVATFSAAVDWGNHVNGSGSTRRDAKLCLRGMVNRRSCER